MWDLRFSQLLCWWFLSSWMWCHVIRWALPSVSGDHRAFIFKGPAVQEQCLSQRWRHYDSLKCVEPLPQQPGATPTRLEFSAVFDLDEVASYPEVSRSIPLSYRAHDGIVHHSHHPNPFSCLHWWLCSHLVHFVQHVYLKQWCYINK